MPAVMTVTFVLVEDLDAVYDHGDVEATRRYY